MIEWFYIGHYGQLGPLTREDVDDLIISGVISRDTYVWKSGMSDWQPAGQVGELANSFLGPATEPAMPPPPPMQPRPTAPRPASPTFSNPYGGLDTGFSTPNLPATQGLGLPMAVGGYLGLKSDKSRILAGLLQIFLPGVGRMYMGYVGIGILQLILTFFTCFVGYIWSFIDGIIILTGSPKYDGYGRHLD